MAFWVGFSCLCGSTFAQGSFLTQEEHAEFNGLAESWWQAPSYSQQKVLVESTIKSLVESTSPSLHDALVTYWITLSGSDEETSALEVINQLNDEDLVDTLLQVYAPDQLTTDPVDFIGSLDALPVRTVDLTLLAPESLEAGDLVTVFGRFRNLGTEPVWIGDLRSTLTVPLRVWGINLEQYGISLPAHFPTIPIRNEEVLRIEGGSEFTIAWFVDRQLIESRLHASARIEGNWAQLRQLAGRTWNTFLAFLFFRPGDYQLTANVHVWAMAPEYNDYGFVKNIGDSFTISSDANVRFDPPLTVLMFGAIIGGLICFILRFTNSMGYKQKVGWQVFLLGVPSALLLSIIGTIMLSRLGGTDFLISIEVQDFWGAIATGFVFQWIGLAYIVNRFVGQGTPQEPVVDVAGPAADSNGKGA